MELAALSVENSGENSWGKSKPHFTEEHGTDVFLFIVPACSWTKASGRYQPVIYFLVWFLFSAPCFLPLFLMHLVIGVSYSCPILVDVTSPDLGSSPRSDRRCHFSTHRARGRPQGPAYCRQASWTYKESEGCERYSTWTAKKETINSQLLSRP